MLSEHGKVAQVAYLVDTQYSHLQGKGSQDTMTEHEKAIARILKSNGLYSLDKELLVRVSRALKSAYRSGIRKSKRDIAKSEPQYISRPGIQM